MHAQFIYLYQKQKCKKKKKKPKKRKTKKRKQTSGALRYFTQRRHSFLFQNKTHLMKN